MVTRCSLKQRKTYVSEILERMRGAKIQTVSIWHGDRYDRNFTLNVGYTKDMTPTRTVSGSIEISIYYTVLSPGVIRQKFSPLISIKSVHEVAAAYLNFPKNAFKSDWGDFPGLNYSGRVDRDYLADKVGPYLFADKTCEDFLDKVIAYYKEEIDKALTKSKKISGLWFNDVSLEAIDYTDLRTQMKAVKLIKAVLRNARIYIKKGK